MITKKEEEEESKKRVSGSLSRYKEFAKWKAQKEEDAVKLNQESIQICPVCEKKSVVVWYSSGYEHTKMFCLECGRFWIESEGINEDPREYIDWKIRELDKKVQEMVEDVKSKLIKYGKYRDDKVEDGGAVIERNWDANKIAEIKMEQLGIKTNKIVKDTITEVILAGIELFIVGDLSNMDAINEIEACLEDIKKKERA